MNVVITGGSGFIGTHLSKLLSDKGYDVFNFDIKKPNIDDSAKWVNCSILDKSMLLSKIGEVKPKYVFHLAAKADVFGSSLDDYQVNIDGTKNLLEACEETAGIQHMIVVSTQLVVKPGVIPKSNEDYYPLEPLYSQSKVLTEELVRKGNWTFDWTIVRPTNIWGPNHPRFPSELWRYIEKRWYIHPDSLVKRSYGYVENVCYQIASIAEVDKRLVCKETFYVGDEPIESSKWVDAFSFAFTGKKTKKISLKMLKNLAIVGDVLKFIKIPFPFYSDRFTSMTTEYLVPMEKTFEILGRGPYKFPEAIQKTVSWKKNIYNVKE